MIIIKIVVLFSITMLSSQVMVSDLISCHGDICAYLDPGTGSFIFQMLIAGFVGGLFALKLFWGQVKSFCTTLFSKRKKEDEPK